MAEDPGAPGELAKPEVQVRKAWRLGETVTGTIAGVGPDDDVVVMLRYEVTAEDGGEKARDERVVVARVALGTERTFSLPLPAAGPCTHRSPKLAVEWCVGARVVRAGTEGPARWMVITVAPAAIPRQPDAALLATWADFRRDHRVTHGFSIFLWLTAAVFATLTVGPGTLVVAAGAFVARQWVSGVIATLAGLFFLVLFASATVTQLVRLRNALARLGTVPVDAAPVGGRFELVAGRRFVGWKLVRVERCAKTVHYRTQTRRTKRTRTDWQVSWFEAASGTAHAGERVVIPVPASATPSYFGKDRVLTWEVRVDVAGGTMQRIPVWVQPWLAAPPDAPS